MKHKTDKEDMSLKNQLSKIDITNSDLDYVISYIKERQTAILVMMFTDIVGFTRITEEKGEKYAAAFRSYHDKILTDEIEKNNSGKVVKYIGDSVMAIFSEPTKAVEIAVKIHEKLDKFNESMPDMEDINIRIGLHMGQVAIENNIQADIFGRHVNRASRIESLASGGQVYLSFPVFDSAKGWLHDIEYLGWKNHGEYYLKGIDKPTEIYEVYNKEKVKPKAPIKAKKKRMIPSSIFIILFTLLGAIISWGFLKYQKTEVFLFDYDYEDVRLITGEKLYVDGEKGDHKRVILNKLSKGSHKIYFDVSSLVRYYSILEVERGENLKEIEFSRHELPSTQLNANIYSDEKVINRIDKKIAFYDKDGVYIEKDSTLLVDIKTSFVDDIVEYAIHYSFILDNEAVLDDSYTVTHDTKSKDDFREDWRSVWSSDVFDLELRAYANKGYLQFNIQGQWNK